MKRELKDDFYDNAYNSNKMYSKHYTKLPYYNDIWKFIATKLNKAEDVIADFGCGPGQFAHFLSDLNYKMSYGVDFSEEAVKMAKKLLPKGKFYDADLYDPQTYKKGKYNTAICLEVLEHLTLDNKFFEYLPEGTKVILTVPDFDSVSHVRYFNSTQECKDRFKAWMKISGGKEFYLGKKRIFVIWGEI